jgi:hypothetical protein
VAFSFTEAFSDLPVIGVVDIGASSIDGPPPYQRLVDVGKARFFWFELTIPETLLKIALLLHEIYGSFALASLALGQADRQQETSRQATYLRPVTQQR